MNATQLKTQATESILELATIIKNNEIEILGSVYTVVKIGKYTISLLGKKGAKHTVTSCPNVKILENSGLLAYSLVSSSGRQATDFTLNNAQTSRLSALKG